MVMRAVILLLCLASTGALAGTKFIDLSGAGSGAADGSSVNNQCAGLTDTDCARSAGNTYYLCGAAASGTDLDLAAGGTSELARVDFDGSCPGGTPGSFNLGRIVGTGWDYWGVSNVTFNSSDAGQSALACFVCQTSNGGSCSSREGTCSGFRAIGNTIIDSGKSGIEIGSVINQTAYGATTGVVVTGNTVTNPSAHGIALSGYMVRPVEGDNTVTGANASGVYNAWGVYTSPRAVSYNTGASWVTAGTTCGGGGFTQYKVTLGSGTLTTLGANEIVKDFVVKNSSNGHYSEVVVGSCAVGSGGLGTAGNPRRWCQNGSDLHVCGNEVSPPSSASVIIATSLYGGAVIGKGDNVSGTHCWPDGGGTCQDDGVGIGADLAAYDVTIRGAYTHNNEGSGAEFHACVTNCKAEGTISANNGKYGFLFTTPNNATDVVSLFDSTAWNNTSDAIRLSSTGSTAAQAYNNAVGGVSGVNCANAALGGGEGGNAYQDCTATYVPTAITPADFGWRGGSDPTDPDGFCLDSDSALLGAGTYIGAYVYGYGGESLTNLPPIGARGLCLGRAPAAGRPAVGARVAN